MASQARPNVGSYGYLRNWLYLFQRVTGVILFFYIGYHVWNTRFVPMLPPRQPARCSSVDGQPLVSTRYMHDYFLETPLRHPGLVDLLRRHRLRGLPLLPTGCGTSAYHWGLTVSPRSQRLWGFACGLIGVTLLALALASLLAFINVSREASWLAWLNRTSRASSSSAAGSPA